MATRTRKTWKPQRDGQFVRQLGWKPGPHGKVTQPKFRLGTDLREAKRREMMLGELWDFVEEHAGAEPAVWPPETLGVAKQIARNGKACVPRHDGESNSVYASRVLALAQRLPAIPLLPADAEAFREELAVWSKSTAELDDRHEREFVPVWQQLRQTAAKLGGRIEAEPAGSSPMLREALRDHIEWLKSEYAGADGELTHWGAVRVKQAELLIERHDDLPRIGPGSGGGPVPLLAAASAAQGDRAPHHQEVRRASSIGTEDVFGLVEPLAKVCLAKIARLRGHPLPRRRA